MKPTVRKNQEPLDDMERDAWVTTKNGQILTRELSSCTLMNFTEESDWLETSSKSPCDRLRACRNETRNSTAHGPEEE